MATADESGEGVGASKPFDVVAERARQL